MEALALQVTERVLDLVVDALDINELATRVDLNTVLSRIDLDVVLAKIDVNALLDRVDLDPLLDRVDVDDLAQRIDMDALVQNTDLGAVIARSTGGMASEALDAVRSQAVGLDQFIDRWVQRLLRRKHPGTPAPQALLSFQDGLAVRAGP